MKRFGTLAVLLCSTVLASPVAVAQEADSGGIDEVIVTAQRRSESLQGVPIAVTVVDADDIRNSNLQTTSDLALLAPGLVMATNRNGLTPFVRGIGTLSGATEGSVAVYLDDVYFASTAGAIFSLDNVERIEVLKGPQGTLFGRNATGGAIRFVTRTPSSTPEMRLSVGYGNYDTKTGSLYATTGVGRNAAIDIALYGNSQTEGYGVNLVTGDDVNFRREWAARSRFDVDLTEATRLTLSADYGQTDTDIGAARAIVPGSIATGGLEHEGGFYDINSGLSYHGERFGPEMGGEQFGGSVRLEHDLSPTLTFTSLSAHRQFRNDTYLDNDGTPAYGVDAFFGEFARSWQQDLLLSGDNGPLQWTAGANYFRSVTGLDPFIVRSASAAANTALYTDITIESYAAFGQASYDLTDRTTLTLGARYTEDDISIWSQSFASAGNPLPVGTPLPATFTDGQPESRTNETFDRVTWRAAIDHELSDNVLAYASVSRGYKAGAFNPTSPPTAARASPLGDAAGPEDLDAYEIGLKSTIFDNRLRLNGAVFFYDYQGIQLSALAGSATSTNLINAAGGEITGVETELVYVPPISSGDLEIGASFSWLDATYTEFPGAPTFVPRTAAPWGNVSGTFDASGNHMIKTPEFSFSARVDYEHPLENGLSVGVNVTYAYTGEYYWEPENRLTQPELNLINAQVSVGDQDDKWRLRFWSRNLLDEEYFGSAPGGTTDTYSIAPPRTFGIALDMSFGG